MEQQASYDHASEGVIQNLAAILMRYNHEIMRLSPSEPEGNGAIVRALVVKLARPVQFDAIHSNPLLSGPTWRYRVSEQFM